MDLAPADRSVRTGSILLLALLVTAAAGKAVLYDTMDPDCFWHLRVAEVLQRDGVGPIVDDLSFMSVKTPWIPYSWLGELAMKRVWDAGGFRAAIAVQSAMIGGIYALIALSCVTACGGKTTSRVGIVLVTLFAIYLSLPYLSFRPATAALLMLAAAVWLLVRDRQMDERTTTVWVLVPLTALMVNVHLFAVLIPVSVGALLAGAMWEHSKGTFDRFESRRRLGRFGFLFALTLPACAATPLLGGVLRTMWHYQSGDAMVAGSSIAELRPFYSGAMGWLAVVLVLGAYGIVWTGRADVRVGEWLWLVGGTVLLLRIGRFAPIFVILAAPVVAAAMPVMSGKALGKPAVRFALAALLCIGVVRIVSGFPSRETSIDTWLNRNGPQTPGYPCGAAAFVQANVRPVTGRVLNEFTWGGYLAWRLGPGFQTFMDGRTQLYTPAFWRATCLGSEGEFKAFLKPVAADAAIVPREKGTLRATVSSLGWTRVYQDDRAEVFVPPARVAHTDE